MEPDRQELERKLKSIFGFDAFYDDQWKTVSAIMKGKRILLIEKTGFWKSLTFQFPATQFPWMTVVFSPLIALMRDQVGALKKKWISAWLINSAQSPDENLETIAKAKRWEIKILYIAPERQENDLWQSEVRNMNLSFVVIDEAHCISSWGHDFRPAFRRIRELTRLLPSWVPVLATTATATREVGADIARQIGGEVEIIRWDLYRSNLELWTVLVNDQDDKLELVSRFIRSTDRNGIVYVGTRSEAEMLSEWCTFEKLNVAHYHAGLEPDERKRIEEDWKANRFKAVISTNALGMGIDKPDIGFIVHTQIPQSPVHYYQEIGRAWRDGNSARIVLLYDPSKDRDLPESFIEWARPPEAKYRIVIDILRRDLCGERDVCKAWNIKVNQWRTIKADLIEQGIIKEISVWRLKKYQYQFGAPELDFSEFDALRKHRMSELEKMIEYVYADSCKMEFLCAYLGDVETKPCGKCTACLKKPLAFAITQETRDRIEKFKSDIHPVLETQSESSNMLNGVAWGYYGLSEIGKLVHDSKYVTKKDFCDTLIELTLSAYYSAFGNEKFDMVLFIPPTKSGTLVENFANAIWKRLRLPVSGIRKIRDTREQKIFENWYAKKDNVANVFDTDVSVAWKKVLIVDDVYDSGYTMKEIWKMLSRKGVKFSAPLVIAKTASGDSI